MSRAAHGGRGPAIRLAGLRKVYTTRGRPPVVAVDDAFWSIGAG